MFYVTLTGQSPVELDDGGSNVSAADAADLQRIAWETAVARQKPTPPLIGQWPLSNATSGNDLVVGWELTLGDTVGPAEEPSSATQFGRRRYAAVPYFSDVNSSSVTVSVHAHRADWAVPIADAQYMVGKWMAYEIYHKGTMVHARVYTTTEDRQPPPITYPANQLSPGWHHFVLTYDGSNYALWVDGSRVAESVARGALRHFYNPNAAESGRSDDLFTGISLGGRPGGNVAIDVRDLLPSHGFTGALARLRIYNIALAEPEIQAL